VPCWLADEDGGALADPDAAGREAAWLGDAADDEDDVEGPGRRPRA
jgi:hypothetical protein